MNNVFFEKTKENVWNHRDIKLVTSKKRRNYLVLEPNYHDTKFFTEDLLFLKKIVYFENILFQINPVYLGLPIPELSKAVIYEFCYDYLNPKYG